MKDKKYFLKKFTQDELAKRVMEELMKDEDPKDDFRFISTGTFQIGTATSTFQNLRMSLSTQYSSMPTSYNPPQYQGSLTFGT